MQEVERLRTNIGYIRVKMLGANFPDKAEYNKVSAKRTHLIDWTRIVPDNPFAFPPSMVVILAFARMTVRACT
ncbi:MAG: hypothetical protein ACI9ZT_001662 [Gammaproteobacteria bacterium]|jgi:hypothetical protein